jgi:hypothetical protein
MWSPLYARAPVGDARGIWTIKAEAPVRAREMEFCESKNEIVAPCTT